jgi:GcrA cell cycle regulator
MAWTDERIEQLKSMWEKGMTASQIAEELGGVSRNAVIGKAHRLGLQSRPSPVRDKDQAGETGSSPAPAPAPVSAPVSRREESPAPAPANAGAAAAPNTPAPAPQPQIRSIGPGGFLRQAPGEPAAPIPPAPPRRLVPARPSPDIAGKTSLLDLNDRICKWPIGHPGEPDFHFCGRPVNPGFPYCVDHCGQAYQAQLPRRDRRPPPPLPYGGPRVR